MASSWKDPAAQRLLGPWRTLARPQAWARSSRWLEVLSTGMFAVFAASLAWVALASAHRYPAMAAGAGTFAALFVLLTPWLFVVRNRPQAPDRAVTAHTTEAGEHGVLTRYAPWQYRFMMALAFLVVGGGSELALAVLLADEVSPGLVLWAMVGAVFAAYFVWVITGMVRGKIVPGYVLLTSEGIYHRFFAFDEFVPWEALAGVTPGYHHGPLILLFHLPERARRHLTTRAWTLRSRPSTPMVVIFGKLLTVDPVLLYHTLGYYLDHPTARSELAAGSGLRRIRTGAFM